MLVNINLISGIIISVCYLLFNASYANNTVAKKTNEKIADMPTLKQHCAICHTLPPPHLMPAKDWPKAVKAMTNLANDRMKSEFTSQKVSRSIAAYYLLNAPKKLPSLPYYAKQSGPLSFNRLDIGSKTPLPLVLNINAVELGIKNGDEYLICDAQNKQLSLLTQHNGSWSEGVLADINIPVHTEVVDFDNDGDNDILAADLGDFLPTAKPVAKVYILEQTKPGQFKKHLLLDNVRRITDLRPVDVDNDNDIDIAIAVFGGDNKGQLLWLENMGNSQFSKRAMMNGSGALNISPIDLNKDGKIDFVSLIAQEHEMAIALINQGNKTFKQQILAKAPHPMFGFTSMELTDLDGDKDLDIILTNGDALDLQPDPKPYHGVQWLENKGNLKFQYHNIGRFYGAAKAIAGDLDNDGDMDVVASSWHNYWQDPQRQSLIWYENNGKQEFTRHNISNRPKQIVTLALKDTNKDNLLDIIAGVFKVDLLLSQTFANKKGTATNKTKQEKSSRLVVFESTLIHNQ